MTLSLTINEERKKILTKRFFAALAVYIALAQIISSESDELFRFFISNKNEPDEQTGLVGTCVFRHDPLRRLGPSFSFCHLPPNRHLSAEQNNGERWFNVQRRRLCKSNWDHDMSEVPLGVWEELYPVAVEEYADAEVTELPSGENNIAYVLPLMTCPDPDSTASLEEQAYLTGQYEPERCFYDSSAVLKSSICNITIQTEGSGSNYDYTMYSIIHSDATVCTSPDGVEYDRVAALQELGYWVLIYDEPVYKAQVTGSTFLRQNVDTDAGIRDLIKLHAYKLEQHPVVVMVDFTTLILQPLDDIIDTFLADPDAKVMYTKDYATMLPATGTNQGIDTGFLLIKPSVAEFQSLTSTYANAPYDDVTRWGGQGITGFQGAMGTSGLLTYYYKDQPAIELDRCIYNNANDSPVATDGINVMCRDANSCDDCRNQDISQVKVAHMADVCGEPWSCNFDIKWPLEASPLCQEYFRAWAERRELFEEKHVKGNKFPKTRKNGNFRHDIFNGYCKEKGKVGYKTMVDIVPVEDWEILCDPDLDCGPGSYVMNDCTCSPLEDPCLACPANTRCQLSPILMCIDCECGFCNYNSEPCCSFNGVNNCKAATNDNECLLQFSQFASFPGEGNACSGVEISVTAMPNGCGCQPSQYTPCTYDPSKKGPDEKCYICTSSDILADATVCSDCRECLKTCDPCVEAASSLSAMEKCLRSKTMNENTCRIECDRFCRK